MGNIRTIKMPHTVGLTGYDDRTRLGQAVCTVLGDERVVGGAEVDEPVPFPALPEQDGGGVERVGDHCRTPVGDEVGLGDHDHVPDGGEYRVTGHELAEIEPLTRSGLEI